jgi:peptidoglycan/xylan/chitin deacetylase (PgdA/CDA1 family)
MRKLNLFLLVALLFVASGCGPDPVLVLSGDEGPATATTTVLSPTLTATRTETATPVPSPTFTLTPSLTPTPTITPSPTWAFTPFGKIVCPILLYHRIAEPPDATAASARYYVTPADFEQQMQALYEWGYTVIPMSLLVTAVTQGADLPQRPIVISFDDGDISVYTTAFPIMQRYGFTGINYLVGNRLGVDGFMGVNEIKALTNAGWEVGSHGMTHTDLLTVPNKLEYEESQSRIDLQTALGVPVDTFAYPFGSYNEAVANHLPDYGYRAAMGLGTLYGHSRSSLLYMSRLEIRNGTPLAKLAGMLPWSGWFDATLTPTFTPTFTPTWDVFIPTSTP